MQYTALVLGSTGLIGTSVINLLLEDDRYKCVYAIVRKSNSFPSHPKLVEVIATLETIHEYNNELKINHIYCCIGSTKRKTPDLKTYFKIDHDYPINTAKLFPCDTYTYISSVGANHNSSNFYLQMKGQTEIDLKHLSIPSLNILRPSLLLGRRNEKRFLEDIAQYIYPILNKVLIGSLRKYRAIAAVDVAKAMINCTNQVHQGIRIFESEEIIKLT